MLKNTVWFFVGVFCGGMVATIFLLHLLAQLREEYDFGKTPKRGASQEKKSDGRH